MHKLHFNAKILIQLILQVKVKSQETDNLAHSYCAANNSV